MIDFTSALYLGLRHSTFSLRPWQKLSAGKPAFLETPEGEHETAQVIAVLAGCEQGTLFPSTLHAFFDLFSVLAGKGVEVYMDADVYPVVRWGIEQASTRGLSVHSFPHYDAGALRVSLRRGAGSGWKPIVVVDGFCTRCGRVAPIKEYLESVREYEGYLIIDDTQSFGILGNRDQAHIPYGRGGGGIVQWSGVSGEDIIVVSSLAKGFGVPIAVLSGSDATVAYLEDRSETRLHCSPPSVAVIRAAEHAMQVNRLHGDILRERLGQVVGYFRHRVKEVGFCVEDGLFPIQTLAETEGDEAGWLHKQLAASGVQTVLHHTHHEGEAKVSFLITARHSTNDIDRAVDLLPDAIMKQGKVSYDDH